jgi:hypothetical protein
MKSSRALILLIGLPGLSGAEVCKDIEGDAERLACYDAENAPAPEVKQPPVTHAPEQVVSPPAAEPPDAPSAQPERDTGVTVAAEAPEDFGRRESVDAPKEFIEARIVEIKTPGPFDYLYLDNGQVWRELRTNSLRFREGRSVTISEGIMNSFDLKMDGANRVVKVKRVR